MASLNRILYAVCVISLVVWLGLVIVAIWQSESDANLLRGIGTALVLVMASALWLSINLQMQRFRKEDNPQKGVGPDREKG